MRKGYKLRLCVGCGVRRGNGLCFSCRGLPSPQANRRRDVGAEPIPLRSAHGVEVLGRLEDPEEDRAVREERVLAYRRWLDGHPESELDFGAALRDAAIS